MPQRGFPISKRITAVRLVALGAAGRSLVLLIACANVANLMTAQATAPGPGRWLCASRSELDDGGWCSLFWSKAH